MNRRSLLLLVMLLLIAVTTNAQKVDMDLFHGMKPRNIGPAGMSGRVTAIAVHPDNPELIYVGTASGGLWKSSSGGVTFEPVFDNENVASIGALAIDPKRPDVIWAGTGEGNPRNSITGGYGLYKSLDAGKTWNLIGLEQTRHIHRILINPDNSDEVYIGAIGSPWAPNKERGVYKTKDGGLTWKQILYTNKSSGVADMVMDPSNPDKIFVAMWDHQRWPWYFNSGGEGSGLYLTSDGGDSFKRLTEGLPEETGRIGLAISKNKPEFVYAWVESDVNAIYRSEDGGATWSVRGDKDIGNRPFYYAEIHVDPENENRVYTLYSGINKSEDGALTFPDRIASSVHSDHHAWWINPDNPKHMIDGNDGGLAITYDMGKSWRHCTNLPLGQFYHISVDMEQPYNIYGGLQDNGSWRGPAYSWNRGGIINEFWEFLIGGDGFDAIPVPGDARYCYAQSQGGSLRRVDLETGEGKSIKPAAENRERLRFNWNAALAQDPFDSNTIYFGSQYVHKSTNRGDKWEKISKDLTTNNPEKQKQRQSGGLTVDATGAENHCTILAIEPSPLHQNLIWAGTDDGQVHITQDGGETWTNVSENIKDMPSNAWIPQLTASEYNAGEAFAVVNDYRQGDYSAYLYQTQNFGKSWTRIIDDEDVWGYVLCFAQDPVEPQLMFAGTEYGLYVSFDGAATWNKWTAGYPTVSTYDMVIHPRENDLVIGTFGRSIWVLDDIRPLRMLASEGISILDQDLVMSAPPDGVMAQTKNLPGYYFRADALYEGENRAVAAQITFYAKADGDDKMKLIVQNEAGDTLNNLEFDYQKGFNRIGWDFSMAPHEMPGMIRREGSDQQRNLMRFRRGARVMPGTYTLTALANGSSSSNVIRVLSDPRTEEPDLDVIKANRARGFELQPKIKAYNSKYKEFNDLRNKFTKMNDLISDEMSFASEYEKLYKDINKKYNDIYRKLTNRREGLARDMMGVNVLYSSNEQLSDTEETSVTNALQAMEEAGSLIDNFIENEWPRFSSFFKENNITLDMLFE